MTELEHAISHITEKFAKDNKKHGLELAIDASNGNMKISLFKKGKQYIATDISNVTDGNIVSLIELYAFGVTNGVMAIS